MRVERLDSAAGILTGQLRPRLGSAPIDSAGIASVVPHLKKEAISALKEQFGIAPGLISVDGPLPFGIAYETPHTLGEDRLAAAAAGWIMHGRDRKRAVVVVDVGTAVTTEVINSDGVYLGGAIAPGPEALRRGLRGETAQLPDISWPETPIAIGASTRMAIEAGLSVMFLDGVRGLLQRTADELGERPFVIATGGWAEWIDVHLDQIDSVEPNLVLEGIRLLTG